VQQRHKQQEGKESIRLGDRCDDDRLSPIVQLRPDDDHAVVVQNRSAQAGDRFAVDEVAALLITGCAP